MASISPETTMDSQHVHYLSEANEVSFEHGDESCKLDPWYRQMESFEQCSFDQEFHTDLQHKSTSSDIFSQYQETHSESNSTNTELLDPPKPPRTAMMCFSLSKSNEKDESKVSIVVKSSYSQYLFISFTISVLVIRLISHLLQKNMQLCPKMKNFIGKKSLAKIKSATGWKWNSAQGNIRYLNEEQKSIHWHPRGQ